MKVSFDQVMKTFDGEEVADIESDIRALAKAAEVLSKLKKEPLATTVLDAAIGLDNKYRALTLRKVCIVAIGAGVQDSKEPDKVVPLYELGMLLKDGGEIEISPEQATTLKTLIAKTWSSPMVSGQACKLLNG
jgi:hypothetical protein